MSWGHDLPAQHGHIRGYPGGFVDSRAVSRHDCWQPLWPRGRIFVDGGLEHQEQRPIHPLGLAIAPWVECGRVRLVGSREQAQVMK